MLAARLKTFLEEKGVPYATLPHEPAYTAQGVAARTHVHGWELAKSVVLKVDGAYALAVLPAPAHVDIERFRAATGAKTVALATEEEFKGLFPGCDVGAMPPFGNLYGLPVYVDERLTKDPSIVFNAGTHWEAVRMDYADFARLVQPRVIRFGRG
ncbi:MAG: YbaK/EbsC family protein [Acidobacteria bacterium]|nr:YbaK/EbsC family protein [Acidobacteriota bacterium]